MFPPSLRHEGRPSIAGFGGIAVDCGAVRHNDGWGEMRIYVELDQITCQLVWMEFSAPLSPSLSLLAVLRALRGAVGGWEKRGVFNHVLALLLHRRLGEICGKIERLMVRFQAGRLWRRAPQAEAGARAAVKTGRRIWPRRFGWLVRAASHQAAGHGAQLRHILEQPEMVELLKAAPQAARMLRPVCRMLAIETSLLQPGAIPPEPVLRAVKPRLRKKRAPVDWGRIPLPRGVLTAVRKRRFCMRD